MDLSPSDKRRCPRCGEEKVLGDNFYRSASKGSRGWAGYCKPCMKQKAVEWQKANPEKKKASDQKRWLKPGASEKLRARLDRWKAENPGRYADSRREAGKRWRQANPARACAAQKKYRLTEKSRIRAKRFRASERYKARHRLRMRDERKRATYKVREMLRLSARLYGERPKLDINGLAKAWCGLVEAHGSRCVYCAKLGDVRSLTIDHMTPKVRGGSDEPQNLAPACRNCNSAKGDKTVEEFEVYARSIGSERWRFSAVEIRSRSEEVCKCHLTSAPVGG